jgi:hypothetical protein
MSAVTYTHVRTFSGEANEAQGSNWFSRLVAALHHSRQLQAAREIERHRHLIAAYHQLQEK